MCICVYIGMHVHLCEYTYVGLCKRNVYVRYPCVECVFTLCYWEEGIKCGRYQIQIRPVSSHTVVYCEVPALSLCHMLLQDCCQW